MTRKRTRTYVSERRVCESTGRVQVLPVAYLGRGSRRVCAQGRYPERESAEDELGDGVTYVGGLSLWLRLGFADGSKTGFTIGTWRSRGFHHPRGRGYGEGCRTASNIVGFMVKRAYLEVSPQMMHPKWGSVRSYEATEWSGGGKAHKVT
jgi:hypothetical protein